MPVVIPPTPRRSVLKNDDWLDQALPFEGGGGLAA